MRLTSLIKPELTLVLPAIKGRDALLAGLAGHIADRVEGIDAAGLEAALIARESKGSTSTPEGVAFPHAMYEGADQTYVVAALVKGGVSFGQSKHPPSDIVFMLVGPPSSAWQHVSLLARLARICHRPGALDLMRQAGDGQALYKCLCAEDERHA